MVKAVLLMLVLSLTAEASVIKATGKVQEICLFSKNYSTYNPNDVGLAMIYIDTLTGACETNEKRIAISTNHPLYESIISTALAAKTTGSTIVVWHLDACTTS